VTVRMLACSELRTKSRCAKPLHRQLESTELVANKTRIKVS